MCTPCGSDAFILTRPDVVRTMIVQHLGVSWGSQGPPIAGGFLSGKIPKKRMMTGGTPMSWDTSVLKWSTCWFWEFHGSDAHGDQGLVISNATATMGGAIKTSCDLTENLVSGVLTYALHKAIMGCPRPGGRLNVWHDFSRGEKKRTMSSRQARRFSAAGLFDLGVPFKCQMRIFFGRPPGFKLIRLASMLCWQSVQGWCRRVEASTSPTVCQSNWKRSTCFKPTEDLLLQRRFIWGVPWGSPKCMVYNGQSQSKMYHIGLSWATITSGHPKARNSSLAELIKRDRTYGGFHKWGYPKMDGL